MESTGEAKDEAPLEEALQVKVEVPSADRSSAAEDGPSALPRRRGDGAFRAYLAKLDFAWRSSLAALLAAILSYVWPVGLAWFTIGRGIAGIRDSLGETIAMAWTAAVGTFTVLPLVCLLSPALSSPVLTVAGVFVSTIIVMRVPWLSDGGKRMAEVMLTVPVLLVASEPETVRHLPLHPSILPSITRLRSLRTRGLQYGRHGESAILVHLLASLAIGLGSAVVIQLLPRPRLAVLTCRAQLARLEALVPQLLDAFTRAFEVRPHPNGGAWSMRWCRIRIRG
jgi:hypothetical protein